MTFEEKFWSKVDRENGPVHPVHGRCWVWLGSINRARGGYGSTHRRGPYGATTYAHRLSWELFHGKDPGALQVLHRCDNPPCVNPAHLFVGTPVDNVRDMQSKGRARQGDPTGERNGRALLTEGDVRDIRAAVASRGATSRALAERYGVSECAVSAIVTRRNWKHVA